MIFEQAIELVLGHEGGYVNDPKDAGGETNWGISKKSYPDLDIKNLTREQAKSIYKKDYWMKCKCDDLPSELRLIMFDGAVNQGVGFMCKSLQEAAQVQADGVIGPVTLKKVNSIEVKILLSVLAQKREARYKFNPQFARFGNGWMARLESVVKKSSA